jgi:catechol 2,3-dioxygenase-like lactoylglutathione lyase family enzyme
MKTTELNPFIDSELITILVVSDLERSKVFYLDLLRAQLYREYGGTSVVIKLFKNWIVLVTSGEPTEDKPDIYFNPPPDSNKVSHSFTIRVQDCKRSYEILEERGIKFITPPYTRGAETRCFFKDPDGHLFEISEFRNSD